MDNHRFLSLALAGALMWALPAHPAVADHDDGVVELPAHANWDHGDLSVLIMPPAHGQIFNADSGVLNGADTDELTPFNSYLKAIEAAIAEWDHAINKLGADWLGLVYEPKVYVLGRDDVPQGVLMEPDIAVVTDENEGPVLGMSAWAKTGYVHTPCVVRMSMSEIGSFSYADMYNASLQEFGHCLGLNHVGSQGGVDPLSERKHPEHDAMNGSYTHRIGAEGTHLHCVSNLDVMALEHVFDYKLGYTGLMNLGVPGVTYMPLEAYGDTCESPPADWRAVTPPTSVTTGPKMASAIDQPFDGAAIRTRFFKRVTGVVHFEADRREAQFGFEVSLARVGTDGSCEWYDRQTKAFVTRDCYSPMWEPAYVQQDQWEWWAPKGLPTGTYRVVSRIISRYANEPVDDDSRSDFTLYGKR